MSTGRAIEDLLRTQAPQVLGALLRRGRPFDACEDAVQEALLAAYLQWPRDGIPDHPRGWLIRVASRRLADQARSTEARQRREHATADAGLCPPPDAHPYAADDTLDLLFLCCHAALPPAAQVALALRAVGGLTTAQIARAFLVPEATMAQRIVRAKSRLRHAGASFGPISARDRGQRLGAVLHVLYLIFNEGHTASAGPELHRAELTTEAIRLTRAVRRALPEEGEVAGLLALMLLTDARRASLADAEGELVPLAEQDRSRWDPAQIREGVALITAALSSAPLGLYQVQAAIAACHAEAPTAAATDWPQIKALYELLLAMADNPIARLNHAVAAAMVHGPAEGLNLLDALAGDARLAGHHRLHSVRAHLLEMLGKDAAAAAAFEEAAGRTLSIPEQRYLTVKARRLAGAPPARRTEPGYGR